ncbi:hypothetical protein H4S01_000813 [Coemansia sp. RSA 2610]|nr:hypothetical protein H4S01_000813 [Coemansia sp. RSA 2610]
MIVDEREENFREMAALGNLRAVTAYLRSGVDVNGQNKMNGWTALHWACVRGNIEVAGFLLRAGAKPDVKSHKGQTPLDVCKSDELRVLFPGYDPAICAPASSTPQMSFVPNYIVNPDLSKAWGMPEDAMLDTQGESGYVQQLQAQASVSSTRQRAPEPIPVSAPTTSSRSTVPEREFLVYLEQVGDNDLLGSVFIDARLHTVTDLAARIRDELDGVPADFALARYNGKQTVPVSGKQESFSVDQVFRGDDDAVVLKPRH